MQREFIEDGWRFRVNVRGYDGERVIKVKFYDNNLHNPALEDVFSIEDVDTSTKTVKEKTKILGVIPWTKEKTVETGLMPLEEHIDRAMKSAWDKIDNIDQSPSKQFDDAISTVRSE